MKLVKAFHFNRNLCLKKKEKTWKIYVSEDDSEDEQEVSEEESESDAIMEYNSVTLSSISTSTTKYTD